MSKTILDLPPPPAGERLSYGEDPLQFGELRLPDGPGPHPLVINIHGGFWRSRYDLSHAGHECVAMTAAGIATWNIEYRRLGNPGGGWAGTFLDIADAADHVRLLATTYPLDLDRVISLGHSAGGHLALWLAARHRIPEASLLYKEAPLPLRAAVSLAGVVNLRRAFELRLSGGIVGELMGGSPAEEPERYAAASPAELLPLGVPQVLIHGTADDFVPFTLSEEYARMARSHGDAISLIPLPGVDHFAPIDPRSSAWPVVLAAVQQAAGAHWS